MFTGLIGPGQDCFYWADFENFYWPGPSGSLVVLSLEYTCIVIFPPNLQSFATGGSHISTVVLPLSICSAITSNSSLSQNFLLSID